MSSLWEILEDVFIPEQYYLSILTIVLFGAGFLLYHFLSEYVKNNYAKKNLNEAKASYLGIITQRLIGLLFLGIIPLLFFKLSVCKPLWYYGINFQNIKESLGWTILLGIIILTANYFFAGKESNLKQYPQIRILEWDSKTFTINSITWVLYLLAYEFMFRGILLFALYYDFGTSAAITISTLLYALAHLPKGKKETLGAIPLGLILCIISIQTGSFLTAFLFHCIMAISNDYYAIRKNTRMNIKI